jgi:hypothetical protein
MFKRQKVLRLVSVAGIVLASGGAAWAATTVAPASAARNDAAHATDVTGPSSSDSTTTDSVTDPTDTTDTTTTSVESTSTTTTVAESTTTTMPSDSTTTTVAGPCKPGWGYGDKNHCHSGPPDQGKRGAHGKAGRDGKHHHGNGASGNATD